MHRTFARNFDSLEPLFAFTGDFARKHGMDESVAYAMNLAVEELFTNMVKYGGGGDKVSVRLDVRGGELVIRLDHPGAAPFDVSGAGRIDVARPLSDRVPGGIGLHLVRRLMDTFDYQYLDGVARVTLTKRLGGS